MYDYHICVNNVSIEQWPDRWNMPKPQTKETDRALKASRGDPTSPENVLKNVIKYQKISTEYFDKMSKNYEEKVQTMNLSLIERNQEIEQLKKK